MSILIEKPCWEKFFISTWWTNYETKHCKISDKKGRKHTIIYRIIVNISQNVKLVKIIANIQNNFTVPSQNCTTNCTITKLQNYAIITTQPAFIGMDYIFRVGNNSHNVG